MHRRERLEQAEECRRAGRRVVMEAEAERTARVGVHISAMHRLDINYIFFIYVVSA